MLHSVSKSSFHVRCFARATSSETLSFSSQPCHWFMLRRSPSLCFGPRVYHTSLWAAVVSRRLCIQFRFPSQCFCFSLLRSTFCLVGQFPLLIICGSKIATWLYYEDTRRRQLHSLHRQHAQWPVTNRLGKKWLYWSLIMRHACDYVAICGPKS